MREQQCKAFSGFQSWPLCPHEDLIFHVAIHKPLHQPRLTEVAKCLAIKDIGVSLLIKEE